MLFTHKEDYVIVANKGGDVYRLVKMDLLNLKHLLLYFDCITSRLSGSKPDIKFIRKNNCVFTMCSVYVLAD